MMHNGWATVYSVYVVPNYTMSLLMNWIFIQNSDQVFTVWIDDYVYPLLSQQTL